MIIGKTRKINGGMTRRKYMVKINREEYSFLKNLDDKWKWIARNRDGGLYKFQETPEKIDSFRWNDRKQTWLGIYGNLFQFIQWENEEPYNIAELIEEYEDKEFYDYVGWEHHKRKKSEVKGIEWLKENVQKRIDKLPTTYSGSYIEGSRDAYHLALQDINQLDEPEVLSEEFINEKVVEIYEDTSDAEVHAVFKMSDLQDLLVPKQDERERLEIAYKDILERSEFWFDDKEYVVVEKPTIPEFVAEFLDGKEDYALYELLDDDFIYDSHDRLARWLYDNDEKTNREREFSLVLAHIHGYEVEVEQKYYVVNNDNRMMLVRMMDGKTITEADPFKLEDMYEGEKESHRLTEQEIKDYDPRYWAFRKPVEELEG